jgi:hypothetical protein
MCDNREQESHFAADQETHDVIAEGVAVLVQKTLDVVPNLKRGNI